MKAILNVLTDLLKPRSIIAFAMYGAWLYIIVFHKEAPPDVLTHLVNTLMGFYFGQRVAKAANKSQE